MFGRLLCRWPMGRLGICERGADQARLRKGLGKKACGNAVKQWLDGLQYFSTAQLCETSQFKLQMSLEIILYEIGGQT